MVPINIHLNITAIPGDLWYRGPFDRKPRRGTWQEHGGLGRQLLGALAVDGAPPLTTTTPPGDPERETPHEHV